MPKLPVLDAKEGERLLLQNGFKMIRSKGSHRIYEKGKTRLVIPFHAGRSLHPKIVKDILETVK